MTVASTAAGLAVALALVLGAAGALADGPPAGGLAITLHHRAGTVAHTLVCAATPSGTLPDPAAACAGLRTGVLTPPTVGPDGLPLVCLQVFYGPETLLVAGTLDGQSVDASFDRSDSCRDGALRAVVVALVGAPGLPEQLISEPPAPPPPPAPAPVAPAPGGAAPDQEPTDGLTILLRDGIASRRHTLSCSPAPAGTLPDPAAACAGLRGGVLAPQDTGPDGFPRICTQAVVGRETLRVTGTLDGAVVDATLNRVDGCRAQDFLRVATVLSGGPGRPDALGPRLRVRAVRTAIGVRAGRPFRVPFRTNRNAQIRITVTPVGGRPVLTTGTWDARPPFVLRTGEPEPNTLGPGRYVIRVSARDYLGGRAVSPPIRLLVR